MALIDLNIFSESLRMQTSVSIVIPQQNTNGEIGVTTKEHSGKYKCLYLLHGLSDDQTIWLRRTSIDRYATELGICVVMPCAGRSFYSDMKDSLKYYTYIAGELPDIVESMFNISPRCEDRYIGGNSMGGYGAIKIALTEENRYRAAFGLSSVADIHNSNFTEVLKPVFGAEIPDYADLFKLSSMQNSLKIKPSIYMSVGKDDYMYEDNLKLSKHFSALDYDYSYIETPGSHTWDLWDNTVQSAMKWMLEV